eukprot:SAG31_NODE_4905_length_2875_cov_2.277017_5_plen_78_part_00
MTASNASSLLVAAFKFKILTCANVFSSAAISDGGMAYFTCNSGTSRRREQEKSDRGHERDAPGIGKAYAVNPSLHME